MPIHKTQLIQKISLLRRWELFAVAFAAVGVVALSGCGSGGGGDTDGTGSLPGGIVAPASRLQVPPPFSDWRYYIHTDFTGSNADANRSVDSVQLFGSRSGADGSRVVGPATAPPFAAPGDMPFLGDFRYKINADSSLSCLGRESLDTTVAENPPAIVLPNQWSERSRINTVVTVQSPGTNPTSYPITLQVEGSETVTLPSGTFATWRTAETSKTLDSAGRVISSTTGKRWWAPDIGIWVKADLTTTFNKDPNISGADIAGGTAYYTYQLMQGPGLPD